MIKNLTSIGVGAHTCNQWLECTRIQTNYIPLFSVCIVLLITNLEAWVSLNLEFCSDETWESVLVGNGWLIMSHVRLLCGPPGFRIHGSDPTVAFNSFTTLINSFLFFSLRLSCTLRTMIKKHGVFNFPAQVRRVQGLVDTLDNMKAKHTNPFSSSCNAVSVTTKWVAFESGVGSLTAPPPFLSSTKITQDWEVFD